MEPSRLPLRAGLKLPVVSLALVAVGGFGCFLWSRLTTPKITDQALLREAVEEWKRAGQPGQGPDPQIFEQQATQGYYEDATATAHLFKSADEVQYFLVKLAGIRAENGDIEGAKAAIARFRGAAFGERAMRNIADVQAYQGDLEGALATASEIKGEDDVLTVFAKRQIDAGDFEEALKTSEKMSLKAAGQLYYDVGDGLRLRHQQSRVRQLASGMQDRMYAAEFRQIVRFTLWDDVPMQTIQATPCDMAAMYATEKNFALADSTIEQDKCPYVVFVAVQQYAFDPIGAERLLRTTTKRDDLISGLDQFTMVAAEKGNLAEAKRFLENLARMGASFVSGRAVLAVARTWTIKDGPKAVLPWARSRPTLEQRTSALIGAAQALGHSRPVTKNRD